MSPQTTQDEEEEEEEAEEEHDKQTQAVVSDEPSVTIPEEFKDDKQTVAEQLEASLEASVMSEVDKPVPETQQVVEVETQSEVVNNDADVEAELKELEESAFQELTIEDNKPAEESKAEETEKGTEETEPMADEAKKETVEEEEVEEVILDPLDEDSMDDIPSLDPIEE